MSRFSKSTANAQRRADKALSIFRAAADELELVAVDQDEVAEQAHQQADRLRRQARDAESLAQVTRTQASKVRGLFG